jgi:hypothetical protein
MDTCGVNFPIFFEYSLLTQRMNPISNLRFFLLSKKNKTGVHCEYQGTRRIIHEHGSFKQIIRMDH